MKVPSRFDLRWIINRLTTDYHFKQNDIYFALKYLINAKDIVRVYKKGSKLYRARPVENMGKLNISLRNMDDNAFLGFGPEECMAPPTKDAKAGRCNKKGHPVLYPAEDMYTALAEVKEGKKKQISIAELELLDDIFLVEFSYQGQSLNIEGIESFYEWISFVFYLVDHNEKEYWNTQVISSCIRRMGYDGILYSSAISANGMNIVLFDQQHVKPINSKLYLIESICYYAEELLPRMNDEKLLPKSITDRFCEKDVNWFLDQFKGK